MFQRITPISNEFTSVLLINLHHPFTIIFIPSFRIYHDGIEVKWDLRINISISLTVVLNVRKLCIKVKSNNPTFRYVKEMVQGLKGLCTRKTNFDF